MTSTNDNQELATTYSFFADTARYGIDTTFRELEKSKKEYNALCQLISNKKEIGFFRVSSLEMTFRELKDLLIEILDIVFNGKYTDKFLEYNRKYLRLDNISLPYDAAVASEIINDENHIKQIYISNRVQLLEIPFIAHEYVHALLAKFSTILFNSVISNYHYNELLSILIEYAASFELDKIYNGSILSIDEKVRIAHHQINLKEHNGGIKELKKNRDPLFEMMVTSQHHLQYGYLISDIYATSLIEIYESDKKALLEKLFAIFSGDYSIDDLLGYYNISLENSNVYDTYVRKLEKY